MKKRNIFYKDPKEATAEEVTNDQPVESPGSAVEDGSIAPAETQEGQ